jgi:hypothetical protein
MCVGSDLEVFLSLRRRTVDRREASRRISRSSTPFAPTVHSRHSLSILIALGFNWSSKVLGLSRFSATPTIVCRTGKPVVITLCRVLVYIVDVHTRLSFSSIRTGRRTLIDTQTIACPLLKATSSQISPGSSVMVVRIRSFVPSQENV